MTNQDSDYIWPVVSDDPAEEGFRILARIILKIMVERRALANPQSQNEVVCHAS